MGHVAQAGGQDGAFLENRQLFVEDHHILAFDFAETASDFDIFPGQPMLGNYNAELTGHILQAG